MCPLEVCDRLREREVEGLIAPLISDHGEVVCEHIDRRPTHKAAGGLRLGVQGNVDVEGHLVVC